MEYLYSQDAFLELETLEQHLLQIPDPSLRTHTLGHMCGGTVSIPLNAYTD